MTTGHGTSGPAPIHPDVAPLAFLVGRWAGEGEGDYPTVEAFHYGEEVTISHVGKPFLAYAQRTWSLDDGRPLHAETGYWRCPSPGHAELVVAHPTGVVEVSEGPCTDSAVVLASVAVARTTSAKEITALVRRVTVEGDNLEYELDMAAVGVPLSFHLRGTLRRVSAPPG
ncbi:MAG: FABP family protein [Acidimicrobiales bacterium]